VSETQQGRLTIIQKLKLEKLKCLQAKRNVFSWRLKVLTKSTRRSGDGRLFHTRGAATANERSPSDDMVRNTSVTQFIHHN